MTLELGGGGLTVAHQVVIEEELAKHNLPFCGDLGISLAAPALRAWGTDEQKARFIPPMLRGEVITWQLFTEPEAGSDLAALKLPAVEDGDDYVLNGMKIFVGHTWYAEWLYVLAVTDPEAPRHQNISAFIVPADAPGVRKGKKEHKLGIHAAHSATIFFENVRVPAGHLVGELNKGWTIAKRLLEHERKGIGGIGNPLGHHPRLGGNGGNLKVQTRQAQVLDGT